MLAENFRSEYEALGRRRVMGIFGAAHADPYGMDYSTSSVPSMGRQLKNRYGGDVLCRDLRGDGLLEPTTVTIAGKEYAAIYYGEIGIPRHGIVRSGEFWRLRDAYGDFSQWERGGGTLPGNEYPMSVTSGESYAIHYRCWDGTDFWWYGVCDGEWRDGVLNTAEVLPPKEETP